MTLPILIGMRLLVIAAVCILGLLMSGQRRFALLSARPFIRIAHKLNTSRRTLKDRAYRGIVITVAITGAGYTLGAALTSLPPRGHWLLVMDIAVLLLITDGRIPVFCWQARRLIGEHPRKRFVRLVRHTLGLELQGADDASAARLSIDQSARHSLHYFWLPVLGYLAGGLVVALPVALLTAMHTHCRPNLPENRTFYYSLSALVDVLAQLAARIAGLMMMATALFVPTLRAHGALAQLFSSQTDWTAMHGAMLNLSLGGKRKLHGEITDIPWTDTGRLHSTPHDLTRYVWLESAARVLFALTCACAGTVLQSPKTTAGLLAGLMPLWPF